MNGGEYLTFNRQVVLDSQNRKTNHLRSISRISIISFPMDGSAWGVLKKEGPY